MLRLLRLALFAGLVVATGCDRGGDAKRKDAAAKSPPVPAVVESGEAAPVSTGSTGEPGEPAKEAAASAAEPTPPAFDLPFPALATEPIPADDPRWAGAFSWPRRPTSYGEPDWDHVRFHAVLHLAMSGRDRARLRATGGDWEGCARAYADASAAVRSPSLRRADVAGMRGVLADALDRDAGICAALASRSSPVVPADGGLAMFRARYLGLVVRTEAGLDVRRAASTLADELTRAGRAGGSAHLVVPEGELGPAEQAAWLARAWADTVDPLAITDPWGAWTLAERDRQLGGLKEAIGRLASGEVRGLPLLPSASVARQSASWSAVELGLFPQSDAWLDLGGFAAPHRGVELATFGSADPAWTRFVSSRARLLRGMRAGEVPRTVRAASAELAVRPEPSRYFNIVALQNGAIRQLARGAHHAQALEVLRTQSPTQGIDWFMPDRTAVLYGLEGRLLALSGAQGAERRLDQAMAESRAFLAFIDMCTGLEAEAAEAARRAREEAAAAGRPG